MPIIDLSVVLNEQTPVYPGDPATKIVEAGVLARDGYADHQITIGTHVGTHIDAPMHMVEHGASLADLAIEQFVGNGVLVDVSDGNFEGVRTASLQPGDIVLLKTGMAAHYKEPVYFETYPVMSAEIAHYLVERNVKMVGLDTCSPDDMSGDFPIHQILLGAGVLIVENLTNLDALPDDKPFTVYALPLNLQIDGGPARVIAEIK